MKILSVILAVVISSFSVLPCADGEGPDNCGTEVHLHAGAGHEDHVPADLCSPFCNCCCCHTHITSLEHEVLVAGITLSDMDLGYSEVFLSSNQFSIWRPPQV